MGTGDIHYIFILYTFVLYIDTFYFFIHILYYFIHIYIYITYLYIHHNPHQGMGRQQKSQSGDIQRGKCRFLSALGRFGAFFFEWRKKVGGLRLWGVWRY